MVKNDESGFLELAEADYSLAIVVLPSVSRALKLLGFALVLLLLLQVVESVELG